jgi:IS30 family transposase
MLFSVIDRGGTVRAAARTAGVHEDAAYTWLRQAGLSMYRATSRKYTEQDKAEFFRRLALNPNVAAVARELGFTRVTCYAWAYKAGIRTSEARRVNPRREEFLRLRAVGLTRAEARERVGADNRSATDWDKGITIIYRGRVYPDGRVVRYPYSTLAGVTPPRIARTIGGRVDLDRVEKLIDPRYLSLLEREQLQDLHRSGLTIRQIAAAMNRSPSTISRELRRNTVSVRGYLPHTAHRLSVTRRARPRQPKLLANPELRESVQSRLRKKWSPQQISNRLAKDFPDAPDMHVSTETIYQAIYVHARGELKRELGKQLRRGRLTRKSRKSRRPAAQVRRRGAADHPPASRRGEPAGPGTLGRRPHHRSSHRIGNRDPGRANHPIRHALPPRPRTGADAVRDSLINTVQQLPAALRGTLTWDQGAEMSEHRAFTIATEIEVYFCEPGAPGSAAPTRTPMACCASTSHAGRSFPSTPPISFRPSPTNSTDDLERHSTGAAPPSESLLYSTRHRATVATTTGIQVVGCSVMSVTQIRFGLAAVELRSTRSSCTGGPALRDRPRRLANTDHRRCWEHSRAPDSPSGDPTSGQLVGDEPVAERRIVVMDVDRGVDQMRVVPVPLADRSGQPGVVRLLGELQHPAGHRDGDPVGG